MTQASQKAQFVDEIAQAVADVGGTNGPSFRLQLQKLNMVALQNLVHLLRSQHSQGRGNGQPRNMDEKDHDTRPNT